MAIEMMKGGIGAISEAVARARGGVEACNRKASACMGRIHGRLACRSGQSTTEYAILVGVLVVIAIVAITMFRPKIEELWNAIANGINGL